VTSLSEIKLRVCEAEKDEKEKGIARLSEQTLQRLGISTEAIIEITCKKTASALVEGKHKLKIQDGIAINSLIRKSIGAEINEFVTVKLATVETATNVTLAPVDMRLNVDEDFTNFVKNRLLERTFVEGNEISIKMLNHQIPFAVVRTKPKGVVKITQDLQLHILNEPFSAETVQIQQPDNLIENIESLKAVPDEKFDRLIGTVLTRYFFDWEQLEIVEVAKETETTSDIVKSTIELIKALAYKNLAGDLSLKSFAFILSEQYQYPQTKIDIITKHYEVNKAEIRSTLLFTFLKDLNSKLEGSGYLPEISARLADLKTLYGHVLDVTTSTREAVSKLSVDVKDGFDKPVDKKGKEEQKKKLW